MLKMDHPLKAWDRAIPLLEELAFKGSYEGIVSNLILFEEHRSPGNRPAWMRFAYLLSSDPFLKSQIILQHAMRAHIDHYLEGTTSDSIRKKYIKRFHDNFSKFQHQQQSAISNGDENDGVVAESIVDVWPFLNCVLDETFLELNTHTGFPDSEPNPKLISTINKRSPLLKKFNLDCTPMKSETKMKNLRPFILSLSSLEHLQVLELFWSKENEHLSGRVLSLIGKTCPLLTRLKIVQNSIITKRDIMAIVLGELVDELLPEKETPKEPTWLEYDRLTRLEVPPQLITPICSSLQELHLFWEWENALHLKDPEDLELELPIIIFILRHFSSLIHLKGDKIFIPEALIDLQEMLKPIKFQPVFEKACQEALNRMPNSTPLIAQRNLHSLSLTVLNFVYVLDRESLQAVGALCPHLKRVTFIGYDSCGQDNEVSDLSPEEMKFILSKWPKLTSIKFHDLSWKKVRSILEVFGPGLKHLKFLQKCKLVVLDLSLCPQLENLFISASCELVDQKNAPSLNTATFLPQLSRFQSDICLGKWASLFEQKSSLVRLILSCCHLGIKTFHSKEPKSKKMNSVPNPLKWSKLPRYMWPKMEVLRMVECPGLTLAMVPHLVDKGCKLKEIWLPHSLWADEYIATPYTVRDQLSSRHPPIDLMFYEHQHYHHHYVHNE